MASLSREYSMEILLSFIEFTQFQIAVNGKIGEYEVNFNDNHRSETDIIQFQHFPSSTPQSAIVRELNVGTPGSSDEFIQVTKICAHKLFKKYIEEASEFEINISSIERQKLSDLMEDLDTFLKSDMSLQELLYLFEYSKGEMKLLQNSSFTRFRNDSDATMEP